LSCLFLGWVVDFACCDWFFVGRPRGWALLWRAPTIAVRSLRSGLPRRHLRWRLRRLPSDSLGRIEVARHNKAQPRGLRGSRGGALMGCGLAQRFAGPAAFGRAGGLIGLRGVLRRRGCAARGCRVCCCWGDDHSGVGWGGGGLAPAVEGWLWLAGKGASGAGALILTRYVSCSRFSLY